MSSSFRVSSLKMQGKEFNSELGKMSLHGETGIVLGDEISRRGIKVDNSNIEVIAKLPPPKCIKDIRSFLEHGGSTDGLLRTLAKSIDL